jgi:hypothetical protein
VLLTDAVLPHTPALPSVLGTDAKGRAGWTHPAASGNGDPEVTAADRILAIAGCSATRVERGRRVRNSGQEACLRASGAARYRATRWSSAPAHSE